MIPRSVSGAVHYDRSLTEPKAVWAEIDYIHANPVRRALCQTPTACPWSSAAEYEHPASGTRGGTGCLRCQRPVAPDCDQYDPSQLPIRLSQAPLTWRAG
jgi:hypothetical protein